MTRPSGSAYDLVRHVVSRANCMRGVARVHVHGRARCSAPRSAPPRSVDARSTHTHGSTAAPLRCPNGRKAQGTHGESGAGARQTVGVGWPLPNLGVPLRVHGHVAARLLDAPHGVHVVHAVQLGATPAERQRGAQQRPHRQRALLVSPQFAWACSQDCTARLRSASGAQQRPHGRLSVLLTCIKVCPSSKTAPRLRARDPRRASHPSLNAPASRTATCARGRRPRLH